MRAQVVDTLALGGRLLQIFAGSFVLCSLDSLVFALYDACLIVRHYHLAVAAWRETGSFPWRSRVRLSHAAVFLFR